MHAATKSEVQTVSWQCSDANVVTHNCRSPVTMQRRLWQDYTTTTTYEYRKRRSFCAPTAFRRSLRQRRWINVDSTNSRLKQSTKKKKKILKELENIVKISQEGDPSKEQIECIYPDWSVRGSREPKEIMLEMNWQDRWEKDPKIGQKTKQTT